MSSKETIYFKGVLANVDSSILQANFGKGFTIESISEKQATKFLSDVLEIQDIMVSTNYLYHLHLLNTSEGKMYAITKTIETSEVFPCLSEFSKKWVIDYLQPQVRLMRLFKEGNICMPLMLYYQCKDGRVKRRMQVEIRRYFSAIGYHIDASEIHALQSFIHEMELPFQKAFLNIAFENFELSYEILNEQVAFLVLMIGLETLMNPAENEVTYRVARNTAVLLGEDRKESDEIFGQVKKLYRKRSEIVHSGKGSICEADLLTLRDYLRRAIKKEYRIGKEKSEIMNLLDSHGFGEKIADTK